MLVEAMGFPGWELACSTLCLCSVSLSQAQSRCDMIPCSVGSILRDVLVLTVAV